MATETSALKTEITQAIMRRFEGDQRTNDIIFGIAMATLGEVAADLIFAAAQDKAHGERLLEILNARIRSRWNELAGKGVAPWPSG